MNLLRIRLALTLGLGVGVAALACDKNDECIADCDAAVDDESGGNSTHTGADPAACMDHTDAAGQFIEQNNACETVLDCVQADGICYHGDLSGPCGSVALSATADLDAWAALADDLAGTCECGAAACGSTVMCTDAGVCESILFSDDYCPSLQRDVQTFLAANKACDSDEDCRIANSICHVDECAAVTLNKDADVEAWTRLDELLSSCALEIGETGEYCNYVGECAYEPVCDEQGQCTPDF